MDEEPDLAAIATPNLEQLVRQSAPRLRVSDNLLKFLVEGAVYR